VAARIRAAKAIPHLKAELQHGMVNTRFFRDEAVVRNGLDGWQIEMLRNFQGREYYVVHWMFATNGLPIF